MTTEREELRLTVSLVDNVSAGLNKIKGEFKDLTEGSGKQHAEKFKRENTEAIAILKRMTGEAGEAYKAFGMMRLGALGAAGGVALLGYEVAKQVKEWGELAEKVRAANQVARAFGIDPGAMRNIQEQLEAAGVSAEQSQGALTKFLDTHGRAAAQPGVPRKHPAADRSRATCRANGGAPQTNRGSEDRNRKAEPGAPARASTSSRKRSRAASRRSGPPASGAGSKRCSVIAGWRWARPAS